MRKGWTDLEPDEEDFLKDFDQALKSLRAGRAACPAPALLGAAHSKVLPEDVQAGVSKHLETCSPCQELAADLAEVSALSPEAEARIRERVFAASETPKAGQRPARTFWLWRPIPIVALASVAVAAGILVMRQAPWFEPGAASVSQPAPVTPKASVLRLERPPVKLPPEALLVWRGESDGKKLSSELAWALAPFSEDQFQEARERLQKVVKQYPRSEAAHFYLGVCHLFLDGNAEAVRSLEKAKSVAGDAFAADIAWYLSLAYHREGRTGPAVAELQKLCQGSSAYATLACEGVKELSAPAPGNQRR